MADSRAADRIYQVHLIQIKFGNIWAVEENPAAHPIDHRYTGPGIYLFTATTMR
jgi:hypothetical protein